MKNSSAWMWFCVSIILSVQCRPSVDQGLTRTSDTPVTINTMQCLSDTSQSYVIALPSSYSTSKTTPLVFVFDPHGDGNLAVNTFLAGASELGYIIAGSNVIRNGYDRIEYALQVMSQDVMNRFTVDHKHLYAAGFSGGGRVAQLFSQLNPDIRSVVSAGAGYSLGPSVNLVNKPSMLFITGNEDFNYLEIINTSQALSGSGIHFYILEYPGKHDWPGHDIILEALRWFELDAMRKDDKERKESFIRSYKASIQEQVNLMEKNHDIYGAVVSLEKGIAFLSGISPTRKMEKKLESLKNSSEYNRLTKRKKEAVTLEMRLRQGYLAALAEKDTLWWKHEISALDERIKSSDDIFIKPVYQRVKSFVSIAAYSYCNRLLSQKNLLEAEKAVSVYQTIDQANPDVYYFTALLLSGKGQTKAAITSYRKAIELGFSDFKKAKQELPIAVYSVFSAD